LNNFDLEEITIIQDADTFLSHDYLKQIVKPFENRKVVIVTGFSLPIKHKNLFGKIIYNGSIMPYKLFSFRKQAQSIRNAVSVVTGDSAAYRTSFLKEVGGLPQGTQTEDMDIAWTALEKRYKIVYQRNARANSKDASTFKGHWKQIDRWYSGGFQCLLKHNFKLFKAKSLLFTTIIPIYFDSFVYSVSFLFAIFSIFFYPQFAIGFFAADLFFTLLSIFIFDWKRIINLFEIYFIKLLWCIIWLYAAYKTLFQSAAGRRFWIGRWDRSSYHKTEKNIKKK
jgi:cellulose synthase/poly-beta-1,6-N-acetylglucosamine synthase-like glycosyltransferase